MNKTYDLIIIGGGPAGMTAAIYAVRANLRILLLDKLSAGGQMINTNEIENYPGMGRVNGAELAVKMFEHTQELGVEFDYKTAVAVRTEGELKRVICAEDGAEYTALAVILCTGTKPRRLNVSGEDRFAGGGISWCAICDGPQYRDKQVVVVGGGNSAVEEALYLSEICTKVTLVTNLDLTADPKACDRLRRRSNVEIHIWQEVLAFEGEERLTGVRFRGARYDTTERYAPCDGVFEYIGFEACSRPFAALGVVDQTGCVVVD
ncbi:MAG: FAD-dependent oxidoreductase, partial [Gracilibacteraceae bacterium]|nr:FAD-dependent oxidoreductase [Gracilibacteraceae bacterium]